MAQKFRIAPSNKIGSFFCVGKKSNVTEEMFYNILNSKVEILTKAKPLKFDETLELSKKQLNLCCGSLTIGDTWFEITGKK